jgi:lipid II:glycine glycyltransferase (peptidoglycan interpeptide bridge formation enzyme)
LQKNDTTIAGFVPLLFEGKITEYYTGSLREFSRFYANELAVWKLLEWGSNNNYSLFDFLGAGNPKKEYGVRDFKSRFGGEMVNYGRFISPVRPFFYKVSRIGYYMWRGIKKVSRAI